MGTDETQLAQSGILNIRSSLRWGLKFIVIVIYRVIFGREIAIISMINVLRDLCTNRSPIRGPHVGIFRRSVLLV
jgi:hypothetical protein